MRKPWAQIFVGIAWLNLLLVGLQFFSAGLGVMGGRSFELHEAIGYMALHLTPLLMIASGLMARLPRKYVWMSVALFIVVFLQPLWTGEFDGEVLGSLHVVAAFIIALLSYDIAHRSSREVRAEAARI